MAAQWYYAKKNGEREGPMTPAKLKQLGAEGWLTPDDLVWKEGLPDWLPAKKVRGLFENALAQALTGKVDGVVVRDAPAAAQSPAPATVTATAALRAAVTPRQQRVWPTPADMPLRYILAGIGGCVAALGLAATVAAQSPVALGFTVLGLCLLGAGLYEEVGRLLKQAAENMGKASREAAERRQEARRMALEHKKLDLEAKRLAQEQPVLETAVVHGGGGNVVVINQAPIRKWSPGLAAVLSYFVPGLGQLYKGQIFNGLVWFFFVCIGYLALFLSGLVLHFFCVLGALSGNPWTEGKTTVVRQ